MDALIEPAPVPGWVPPTDGSVEEYIKPVPVLDLQPAEVDALVEELREYHALYSPLFARQEQRDWAGKYLHGLLLEIPRKSIEPMVMALEGPDPNAVRAVQQFLSKGAWEDDLILHRHWQEVDQDLGTRDGVLIVDGSDFLKQGQDSVGVKRQYCGEVGNRANWQAGVFLGDASAHGYTVLDRRLYLPREWVEDDAYAERRQKCGVPADILFQTKPTLAAAMVQAVMQTGSLRARWLTCDEGFGQDPAFLDAVAEQGLWYYAEVSHATRVWRHRPATAVPEWSGRGRRPTKEQVLAGEPEPETVEAIAASLPPEMWTRETIYEGSQGPLVADFALLRVVAVRDGLPGPDVWLGLRRDVFTGELKTFLSNAPPDTPRPALVRLSGLRWPIETGFEDSKQLVGMGDYEVRSWRGWHHHMTLCILAHFFLVRMCLRLKKKPRP